MRGLVNLVNPFELSGNWYKANLHTHTTASDGEVSADERVRQYRAAGYDVLAITDHRVTADVTGLSDDEMLVIGGMEYHPACPTWAVFYHLVAIHVPHGFAFDDPDDANGCIRQVRRAGGETILAHPYWSGQGYGDFRNLEGLAAMEVYNSTCDRHGRPCSESEWGIAIDRGMVLPCVAVDDCHRPESEDVFESWTWLRMESLSVADVLQALRSGTCYASCGPEIHDFRIADGQVRLRCSPAAKIQFVGRPGQGSRRRAEPGHSITTFAIEVPDWPYVRAVVTDRQGRRAWANPIVP